MTKKSSLTIGSDLTGSSDGAGQENQETGKTRRALLAAALALFADRGIYEPTIEEITEKADVGKGTFYQHFLSREALIAELTRNGFALLLEEAEKEAADARDGDGRLRAIFKSHGAFFAQHPEYLLLFHQARGWMKVERHHYGALREVFSDYVFRIADLMGDKPSAPGGPPSPRAVAVAGFIAGVLSFEFILASEVPKRGLEELLALLVGSEADSSGTRPGTAAWRRA